jgi:hypothetical protein
MRLRIGLVLAAVMLVPLIAVGGPRHGPALPGVAAPAPAVHVRLGGRPHPCTPYAGCDIAGLTGAGGAEGP